MRIDEIAFYAIAPERRYAGLIPIYAQETAEGGVALAKTGGAESGEPLFYGLPESPCAGADDCPFVGLFECRKGNTGVKRYSTKDIQSDGWVKSSAPICYVWKNFSGVMLADWEAAAAPVGG